MYYNNTQALMLLGHICNDLTILRNVEFEITEDCFDTKMHKLIFRILNNIFVTGEVTEADSTSVCNYLAKYEKQYTYFREKDGPIIIDRIKQDANKNSLKLAYETTKKFEILRDLKGTFNIKEIYNPNISDIEEKEEMYRKFESMSISDVLNYFKLKLGKIDNKHGIKDNDYKKFNAGEGMKELLQRCKEKPIWGKSFQSKYMNTAFRGMLKTKYMIRSAGTGGGKSRQMIADAVDLSVEYMFDINKDEWVYNTNGGESVTYITTELTEEEVQLAMVAYCSGVPEETIKDGKWTRFEEERIMEAEKLINESRLRVIYTTDMDMTSLQNDIEKDVIENEMGYLFLDYIQLFPSLSRQIIEQYGYVPREDEMLKVFSAFLKKMANSYKIFLGTATQINRSYKDKGNVPDATHVRGGMALVDKADILVITLECDEKDLDKVRPIIDVGFSNYEPTHMNFVCKNRGGSWKGIVIWTNMDLDNIRIKDCFVTDNNFKLIDKINPTELRKAV